MKMTKIEHLGKHVPGSANTTARLHMEFSFDGTNEEALAISAPFRDSLEWDGGKWHVDGHRINFQIDTRREFALLPLMIRRFSAMGFAPAVLQFGGVQCNGTISLADSPAEFWREIALAQMFFRE